MAEPDYRITEGKVLRRLPDGSLERVPLDPGPELKPSGTILTPMGRPRRTLEAGGAHLLLFPKFLRWLKNPPKHLEEWKSIPDKRTWFLKLSAAVMLEESSGEQAGRLMRYCNRIAPSLTPAAHKLLKGELKRKEMGHYRAATSNPSHQMKLSPVERKARARMRRFADEFARETEPNP